jgi:serine/threonine-protein kinase HipA
LLEKSGYFYLTKPEALAVMAEVHHAVAGWCSLAMSAKVGLTAVEVEDFAPAFEHPEMERVSALFRRSNGRIC